MANTNNGLNQAKANKNDEFFTRYEDIANECAYYKEYFRDKTVYCNCDDYRVSNFVKYFKDNFKELNLKRLYATNYNIGNGAYLYVYDEYTDISTPLDGDGSFDSPECIRILEQSDIVVTNPPFSLARKHMDIMFKHCKQILVLGNTNSITFKEFFPHIRAGELWIGASHFNTGMYFYVPEDYPYADTYKFDREREGKKALRVASICWYTNMRHDKLNAILPATETLLGGSEPYLKYDNYDAIEVPNVYKIPKDYNGVMGVPITFLGKWNPDQYEVLGCSNAQGECEAHHKGESWNCKINGKDIYKRLFIRRKK